MALQPPLAPTALQRRYTEFNYNFAVAQGATHQGLAEIIRTLQKIQSEMMSGDIPAGKFQLAIAPGSPVLTKEELEKDLTQKITALVQKQSVFPLLSAKKEEGDVSLAPIALYRRYTEFNLHVAEAQGATQQGLAGIIRTLQTIQREMMTGDIPAGKFQLTIARGSPVFEKVFTKEELEKDLNQKITALVQKQSVFPLLSAKKEEGAVLDGRVGFSRLHYNNCWANSMLQMCLHVPHLKAALSTVGNYYCNSKSSDQFPNERVLELVKAKDKAPERLEEAVAAYNKIEKPIVKLCTIHQLLRLQQQQPTFLSPEEMSRFICPPEYEKEILEEFKRQMPPRSAPDAIKAVLEKRDAERRSYGQALITALEAPAKYAALGRSIPVEVSQDVRLAFHELSEKRLFSPNPMVQEDAYEAVNFLMTKYEEILKLRGEFFPGRSDSPYVAFETRRYYAPMGAPEPANPTKDYPTLSLSGVSSEITYEHQMLLTLPSASRGLTLEDLLENNSRFLDTISDPHYCRVSPQNVQKFRRKEVHSFFHTAPAQLVIGLNRFIVEKGGKARKNLAPIKTNEFITLPLEMTPAGKPHAYALSAFMTHTGQIGGGHYVAYVKHDEGWMEYDDDRLRYVSAAEIGRLLSGSFQYCLVYGRVPQEQQQEKMQRAVAMRGTPSTSSREYFTHLLGKLGPKLAAIANLKGAIEQSYSGPQIAAALNDLDRVSPEMVKQIHALGAILGTKEIDASPTLKNQVLHMLTLEELKRDYVSAQIAIRHLKHFISIVNTDPKKLDKGILTDFFNALPRGLQRKIKDRIAPTPIEQGQFKRACGNNTLHAYIRNAIAAKREKNLQPLIEEFIAECEAIKKKDLSIHLQMFENFLKDPALSVEQLNQLFKMLPAIKKTILDAVCDEYELGDVIIAEAFFEADPRCLSGPLMEKIISGLGINPLRE